MAAQYSPTTGIPDVDRAIGGVIAGDNLVWEVDSGVAGDDFISSFVKASEQGGIPIVYVSFNRSPQTIAAKYSRLMSPGSLTLIDCFSSGKGNSDEMFLRFFDDPTHNTVHAPIHIAEPGNPARLEQALINIGTRGSQSANYVFDSLTGMLDLWGDENRVVRFFGHLCPRLYDLSTIAYWLVETQAHSDSFHAKVRHITQVVIEVSLSNGQRSLTLHKAAGRNAEIGTAQPFDLEERPIPKGGHPGEVKGLDRLTRRGEELRRSYRVDSIVGGSAAIRRLLGLAAIAARSRASVLITGETGTGKELIANVVHYNSRRAGGPLIKVNCGALPESLLETELFGHVKGAFTGAVRDYEGRFRAADGGSLFLDEVSEMSPRLQVKLLRVLQERQFEPVGSTRTVTVDVRIITATSRDLRSEIQAGRFRHDLFYRLNVIPIKLPPLRERREDIPLLADHFLEKYSREADCRVVHLSREVLDMLLAYAWPGNIRELENCIERAVVMSTGDTVDLELIPEEIREYHSDPATFVSSDGSADSESDLNRAILNFLHSCSDFSGVRTALLTHIEKMLLTHVMNSRRHRSESELARVLGISRITLRKKLAQFGLKSR